ncbi:MAG TPA: tyrosine-type recombinase/integrase, partial [Stellaceae bacterium]|nr:tyrosine-type recombinase/integrase [Stellaceae bacterium]
WSEVDRPGRCLRLESTKEGRSIRPAGAALLDVLDKAERRAGCDYVLFGAARPANDKADGKDAKSKPLGHYRGLPKAWARIAKRAKLPHVTPHTLRHSFASVANELGYTLPTIGAMLGHASGDVTSRYIHHVDAALVSAADRVAQHIWSYMTGEAADVRPMKPAKVTA